MKRSHGAVIYRGLNELSDLPLIQAGDIFSAGPVRDSRVKLSKTLPRSHKLMADLHPLLSIPAPWLLYQGPQSSLVRVLWHVVAWKRGQLLLALDPAFPPVNTPKPPSPKPNQPIVTSKLMGLSPIFLSIMVASRKAPKRKNSSIFPVQFCRRNPRDRGSGQPEGHPVLGRGVHHLVPLSTPGALWR